MIHYEYYFLSVGDFFIVVEYSYKDDSALYGLNIIGHFYSDDSDRYKYFRDNYHPSVKYLNMIDEIYLGILDICEKNT